MIKSALLKKVASILLTIGVLSFILPGMSFALAKTGDLPDAKPTVDTEVDKALQEEVLYTLQTYAQALSEDKKALQGGLSTELNNLVNERRNFYQTFFQLGLHSTLISIESEYILDTSGEELSSYISVLSEKQIAVRVDEMVTLAGRYNAKPEEYPMNQAAQWALDRTGDERVRQALRDYIQSATEDIMVSSGERGFEVVFVLRHSLVMERNSEGLQIVKDAYTDISIDNTGIDNVIWDSRGQLTRNLPDYRDFVDYRIYNRPVEELGREMLEIYEKLYSVPARESEYAIRAGLYNRNGAANYINTYTSNPTKKCRLFSSIVSDETKWNSSYTKYTCTDCANYVSQGLRAGGIPTDGTWYKDSNAWIRTSELDNWLIAKGYGVGFCPNPPGSDPGNNVSKGDIAFTASYAHAVMISSVGPTRFSAHTNDRLDVLWNSSLVSVTKITY